MGIRGGRQGARAVRLSGHSRLERVRSMGYHDNLAAEQKFENRVMDCSYAPKYLQHD